MQNIRRIQRRIQNGEQHPTARSPGCARDADKRAKRCFAAGSAVLIAFALWTVLVQCVDVRCVGPEDARVGFSTMNLWFHALTGVHESLYILTDWLGLLPLAVCLGFAVLGAVQWGKRRHIARVDPDILWLGGLYGIAFLCYLLFDWFPVNYRPILINGILEPSYPSSTTLLVLTVLPALALQLCHRGKSNPAQRAVVALLAVFTLLMLIGRLISGVHWLSDILGGLLLGLGLFLLYAAAVLRFCTEDRKGEDRGIS